MRSSVEWQSEAAANVVRDIRRATRRQYTAEEKGPGRDRSLRGEESIAELCLRERMSRQPAAEKKGCRGWGARRDSAFAGDLPLVRYSRAGRRA